jgi:uracil-DNA glycosylase
MFTGDRSGDWLYRALHRAGFANQSEATHRRDGLRLIDAAITAVCHCAPPDNKPSAGEIENCYRWLRQSLDQLAPAVTVALGQIAWRELVKEFVVRGWLEGSRPAFSHLARVALSDGRWLLGSYHPSQQNTFTGRLTEPMFDEVFSTARRLLS